MLDGTWSIIITIRPNCGACVRLLNLRNLSVSPAHNTTPLSFSLSVMLVASSYKYISLFFPPPPIHRITSQLISPLHLSSPHLSSLPPVAIGVSVYGQRQSRCGQAERHARRVGASTGRHLNMSYIASLPFFCFPPIILFFLIRDLALNFIQFHTS